MVINTVSLNPSILSWSLYRVGTLDDLVGHVPDGSKQDSDLSNPYGDDFARALYPAGTTANVPDPANGSGS